MDIITKSVYIYGLEDPRTSEIRYVGKSIAIHKRYNDHISSSVSKLVGYKTRKEAWLSNLATAGLVPILCGMHIIGKM